MGQTEGWIALFQNAHTMHFTGVCSENCLPKPHQLTVLFTVIRRILYTQKTNTHVSPRLTFNSGLTIDIKQITYQWNSSPPTIPKIINARRQTFRVIINLTLPDQSQRSRLLVTANDALSAVCRIAKCGMQNLWWYQVCLLVVPHGSHNHLILWPPLTVLFTRWQIHRCHICLNQHQVVSHSCMRFGTTLCDFLPQDAMLVRYLLSPCVCPIICLTICNS